jgi:hypothetical protein
MPPHVLVAAGALAGLAASTATFPLEVRALLHDLVVVAIATAVCAPRVLVCERSMRCNAV